MAHQSLLLTEMVSSGAIRRTGGEAPMKNKFHALLRAVPIALLSATLLIGCNSSSKEEARLQDSRQFTATAPSEEVLTALEIEGATLYSGLHDGEHGKASYLIQVRSEERRVGKEC